MRIVEHYDAGMVAMECVNFWRIFGYRNIRVAVMDGMADIVIWGGKLFRPRKEIRQLWNDQKINGICYTVERRTVGGLILWNSKNWDSD